MRTILFCASAESGALLALIGRAGGKRGGGVSGDAVWAVAELQAINPQVRTPTNRQREPFIQTQNNTGTAMKR